jgi:hypothetical protein
MTTEEQQSRGLGAHDSILPDRINRLYRIERVRTLAAGAGL